MEMTLAEELKNAGERTTGINKSLLFIKLTCWLGIVADALWAVGLLAPQVYPVLTGNPGFAPDFQSRQLMLLGGSLMTGWTFLLIWTLQSPVERRGVFLITACPVIFGLIVTTGRGVLNGNPFLFWVLIKCAVLMFAMVSSFILAGRLARRTETGAA